MKKHLMIAGAAAAIALPTLAQAQVQRTTNDVIFPNCQGLEAEQLTECLNRAGVRGVYTFTGLDTNRDGRLTAVEIERGLGYPAFDPYTRGPNGRLTAAEFDNRHAGTVRFADWNRDNDTWLSDVEISTGILDLWDNDGNGWLDEAEFDLNLDS